MNEPMGRLRTPKGTILGTWVPHAPMGVETRTQIPIIVPFEALTPNQ